MLSRSRRIALAALLLLALPLAAVVAAFASGAAIDLSRWRDLAERQASTALGRPVVLQGALRLRLGRERCGHQAEEDGGQQGSARNHRNYRERMA